MKILIACEESQAVCKAFREKGHEAFSCDILPCSGGHPEWHIQDDVLKHLDDGWDMMIAHPPCTHLCVSGARHFKQKIADGRQQEGIDFFMKLINAPIEKICVENPIGIMSSKYQKPTQIIHPWQFGEPHEKSTCLWLKNLPKLQPTKIVEAQFITMKNGERTSKFHYDTFKMPKEQRSMARSKTFPGIAKAMAEQWLKERQKKAGEKR